MNPVNGGALWREIEVKGTVIDGQALPAGIDVGVGIYSLQRQENIFRIHLDTVPNAGSSVRKTLRRQLT